MKFYPEGTNPALVKAFYRTEELKKAIDSKEISEGSVTMCDSEHRLHVDLGGFTGIIPKNEGALGLKEGTVRDIALLSRVNRRVCYQVVGFHRNERKELVPVLSRRSVQIRCRNEYLSRLREGDVIDACVTRLDSFGAFIDVGAGIPALIPIDMLSVSRIRHPKERLHTSQPIRAVLKKREDNKLTFSLKELLGTWEENAAAFHTGDTVPGIVRGIEPYGVFIELAPNLAGLAEPCDNLFEGQSVSVYIKSMMTEKMKIKLAVVDTFDAATTPPLRYFTEENHLEKWEYSPPSADKKIISFFSR